MTNESGIPSLCCEEQYAVHNFKEIIIRQLDGRYVVLPMFKKDAVPLKNNYFLANIRYRSLMKSLHKYPERLKSYNDAKLKILENEEIELVNETAKDSKNPFRLVSFATFRSGQRGKTDHKCKGCI